jgi:hypothetical protein
MNASASDGFAVPQPLVLLLDDKKTMWYGDRIREHSKYIVASDKVYQLLAHGRWFSLGNPASSTIKTGRHDIAEILIKVALNVFRNARVYFLINCWNAYIKKC